MLVTGDIQPSEYKKLAELIKKIDKDDFSKRFFIGIDKEKGNYNLLTSEGNYKVEIGDLDNIDFKVKGFKTFVEKYLVYQDPQKYSKISVKYDNQIVTTFNPYYKENDSIIAVGKKELEKAPELAALQTDNKKNTSTVRKTVSATPKKTIKKEEKTSAKKKTETKNTKPKTKMKIE